MAVRCDKRRALTSQPRSGLRMSQSHWNSISQWAITLLLLAACTSTTYVTAKDRHDQYQYNTIEFHSAIHNKHDPQYYEEYYALDGEHRSKHAQRKTADRVKAQYLHPDGLSQTELYTHLELPEYWMPTLQADGTLLIESHGGSHRHRHTALTDDEVVDQVLSEEQNSLASSNDSSSKHDAPSRTKRSSSENSEDDSDASSKHGSSVDSDDDSTHHSAHKTEAPTTEAPTETTTPKPTAPPKTPPPPPPKPIEVRDGRLYSYGWPMNVQGVCYSPVPIGESVNWPPMGDYFTPDYAYIWQRDLPLIKAMGATIIRIYGWNNNADHTLFLDAVHSVGLKVLVTFYLGDAKQTPVWDEDARNGVIMRFVEQVDKYRDHPAIAMWSFGNELNGYWNGFMKGFSDAFGCYWQAGCAGYQDTNSDCQWQSTCTYYQLFHWINSACKAAKVVAPDKPCISGMADVDYMVGPTPWLDKVARFNWVLTDIDAWAIQLYRGFTFGGYFQMFRGESNKPMIVTEYGIDAYNDPCGWPENNYGGCRNTAGDGQGGDVAPPGRGFWGCAGGGECSKPGVQTQLEWDMRLTSEIMGNYMDRGGIVWGGFLMAWTDEYWKGVGTQDFCWYPCPDWNTEYCKGPGFDAYRPGAAAGCTQKAHFTCSNYNTHYHDLCGYFLSAAPDNYVNEEWFGITAPIPCGRNDIDGVHRLDSLYIRPVFLGIQQLWTGTQEVDTKFTTCESLTPCWHCATSHPMDDLQKGACRDVCKPNMPAIGWGSSHASDNIPEPGRLPNNANWWQKFGLPLVLGLAVLAVAGAALTFVILQRVRHRMSYDNVDSFGRGVETQSLLSRQSQAST